MELSDLGPKPSSVEL